eukprot:scaffold21174_cov52-Phaeocystis_antarctica.AAC.5
MLSGLKSAWMRPPSTCRLSSPRARSAPILRTSGHSLAAMRSCISAVASERSASSITSRYVYLLLASRVPWVGCRASFAGAPVSADGRSTSCFLKKCAWMKSLRPGLLSASTPSSAAASLTSCQASAPPAPAMAFSSAYTAFTATTRFGSRRTRPFSSAHTCSAPARTSSSALSCFTPRIALSATRGTSLVSGSLWSAAAATAAVAERWMSGPSSTSKRPSRKRAACIACLHAEWATSMARRPSASVSPAVEGVALTASPSQAAWAVLVRMNLKKAGTASGLASRKACSWPGVSLRGSTMRRGVRLGPWGEGQLLAVVERAAAEDEIGEGPQLPELRRQLLQQAVFEVELGEGLQLPDLGRQHLQLAAAEVERLDAVTRAPRDPLPRAWALAIGPPLLQRRARRPHRPQRVLVRIRHLEVYARVTVDVCQLAVAGTAWFGGVMVL